MVSETLQWFRRKSSPLAIALLLLASSFCTGFAQPLLRTDGYYFYDNGYDTLYLLRDSLELIQKTAERTFEQAYGRKAVFKASQLKAEKMCWPKGYVPVYRSPLFRMLAFFPDSTGLMRLYACPTRPHAQESLDQISAYRDGARKGLYKSKVISGIRYGPGNRISFRIGSSRYDREDITGYLYPDRLVLNVTRYILEKAGVQAEGMGYGRQVYRFYPYGRLPEQSFRHLTLVEYDMLHHKVLRVLRP